MNEKVNFTLEQAIEGPEEVQQYSYTVILTSSMDGCR